MKKIIILSLSLLTSAVLFTSCKKDTTVTQQVNNSFSLYLTINSGSWSYDSGSNVYYYDYNGIASVYSDYTYNLDQTFVALIQENSSNTSNDGASFLLNGSLEYGVVYGNYIYSYQPNADKTVTIRAVPINNTITVAPQGTFKFNVVVIAPEDYSTSSTSNINSKDINAIKRTYNVKEISK